MAGETSTGAGSSAGHAAAGADRFVAALDEDDPTIGGKARSLARLAALGLPIPKAFVVTTALWTALRQARPAPLPARLTSVDDVDLLAAARKAMREAPLPAEFQRALETALDGSASQACDPETMPHTELAYSVRSSSPIEDRPGALGAGVFDSVLRVGRSEVKPAIRRVLDSAMHPAAWAYALGHPSGAIEPALAVLIHPFIPGNAHGAVAWQPSSTSGGALIAVESGVLSADARRTVEAAARTAGGRYGAVELEWVAEGARVVFLQLRPYESGRSRGQEQERVQEHADTQVRDAFGSSTAWHWDSAHNPAPLSVAHAGLVEWVDRVCIIGMRQRVVGGYLFWRPTGDESPGEAAPSENEEAREFSRASFDHLVSTVAERVHALGEEPPLESALELFASAYQTLFGRIAPACRRARARLNAALVQTFGEVAGGAGGDSGASAAEEWLAAVPSAATARLSAARGIATARDSDELRAAIAGYLDRFGDESARWDVAEPTWRERPERLVLLAQGEGGGGGGAQAKPPSPPRISSPQEPPTGDLSGRLKSLAPDVRQRLGAAVASARAAAAVMEDDDALYATLQATVRRGLLALGRQLHATSRLTSADDVFDLPLPLLRALAAPHEAARIAPEWAGRLSSHETLDLKALATTGKAATERARHAPPLVYSHPATGSAGSDSRAQSNRSSGRRTWHGLAGAPGKVVGHAVHHPSDLPLPRSAILIASTLLPTELPLIFPAAIVTETGSPLGHVAAQARERGIPAVVGLPGALAALRPGALLLVDGERGEITRLDDEPA